MDETGHDPTEEEEKAIDDANSPPIYTIDDAMKGIKYRERTEVQLKRRNRCKQYCIATRDVFYRCCTNCGILKQPEINTEAPPKRYIYFGPEFDNKCNTLHDNKRTTKPPHLEYQDTDDYPNGSEFVSNYISTTKYTILTFLPINLFEQFRKKANLYFLIMACLASTSVSPKDPIFSWIPLTFVLSVSAIKEAYEDYKRYEMDKEINNRLVDAFRCNPDGSHWKFIKLPWKDIVVGDMVRITQHHCFFPADIVLLQSSTNQGLCNIETANLDGETNLKIKQALGATYSLPTDSKGDDYLFNKKLQFKLESQAPNENISKYEGALYFYGDKEAISAGANQMLLRGCTLKNTQWVIGCVVATGVETKISLNSKKSVFKRSNVDVTVDYGLYFIFLWQQCLCIFAAIYHGIWLNKNADAHWYQYIESDGSPQEDFTELAVFNYFTFLILLDILVPISLYVSMELVKFTQAFLITMDDDMVDIVEDETGQGNHIKIRAQARTSNLNEELGQISFIFTDKTGTLTENKMAFLKCHIDGVRYGPNEMERQGDFMKRVDDPVSMPRFNGKECLFTDNRLAQRRNNCKINEFLTLLSVCHSIIPQYPMGDDSPIVYNASSPDEKALVLFAKNMHYYFYNAHVQILEMDRFKNMIDGHRFYVDIFEKQYQFDIYNMLEFDSRRKRMSVIVLDPRDEKIKLYCKGADNVIYQRLHDDYKPNGDTVRINEWEKTLESLQVFAADGLRTLVCGYKEIDIDIYCEWLSKLSKAKAAMENRDILVEGCYDEIERDLCLLGATAIEDKLQDGVPDTIANLSVAGISIWILTGDKVETAINIGRSCRLLTHQMNREDGSLFVIDPDEKISDEKCHEIVTKALEDAWEFLQHHDDNDKHQGFVISGKALSCVFPHREHDSKGREIPPTDQEAHIEAQYQEDLLQCLRKCRAVLCCRVSPIQKAQMVSLVKQNIDGVITLAIGDGANDVPMIRSAHVGIGISGQEGLQAVMASDYSIGQFRFLQELLLIHGAWDYRRISILILYSFYKNVMLSMTQIYYGFYSGFSGTLFYDQLSGSSYNLVFTALPVMFAAVFDRYYTKTIAKLCPELYENGPRNKSFNLKLFLLWFVEGLVNGLIIFFCSIYFIDSSTIKDDGTTVGFWVSNTTMFTSVVTVASAKIMIETKTWNVWGVIFFFLSYLIWYLFTLSWSSIPLEVNFANQDMYGVAQIAFKIPQFWFVVMLTLVICMYPDILWKFIRKLWKPTRLDVIEEIEFIKKSFDFNEKKFRNIPMERTAFVSEMITHQIQQKEQECMVLNNQLTVASIQTPYIPETISLTQAGTVSATSDDHKIAGEVSIRARAQSTPRAVRTVSDLGFSDFGVGPEHSDYMMSQQQFLHTAMMKKQFSVRIRREDMDEDDDEESKSVDTKKKTKKGKEYAAIAGQSHEPLAVGDDDDVVHKRKKHKSVSSYKSVPGTDDEEEDEIYPL